MQRGTRSSGFSKLIELPFDVDLADRQSLYQVWLKTQGYPRNISPQQEQDIRSSGAYKNAEGYDGVLLATVACTVLFLLRDIIMGCCGLLVLLGALGGFVKFWGEVLQSSFQGDGTARVFGPFTYRALLVGHRKAQEANLPPTMEQIDFDSIEILEPVVQHVAQPMLNRVDVGLKSVRARIDEQTGTLTNIRTLTKKLANEVSSSSDEQWRTLLLAKLERLEATRLTVSSSLDQLRDTELSFETLAKPIRETLDRLNRYRKLFQELDQVERMSSGGDKDTHADLIRADLVDITHNLRSLKATLKDAESISLSNQAAIEEVRALARG